MTINKIPVPKIYPLKLFARSVTYAIITPNENNPIPIYSTVVFINLNMGLVQWVVFKHGRALEFILSILQRADEDTAAFGSSYDFMIAYG